MSTPSTEPMRKRDVVVEHVHQLLRLLLIAGIVALALSAFYVALGLTALLLHFALFIVLAGESVSHRLYGVVAVFRQRLTVKT
jgi:hypothetical protein